ncbi:hypothetical protein EV648_101143 [Kribbella sp. VKM Ac-2568]|nr:hypothetical protein EV648_101143 [Kribbella sp. VKM Ac-2568]
MSARPRATLEPECRLRRTPECRPRRVPQAPEYRVMRRPRRRRVGGGLGMGSRLELSLRGPGRCWLCWRSSAGRRLGMRGGARGVGLGRRSSTGLAAGSGSFRRAPSLVRAPSRRPARSRARERPRARRGKGQLPATGRRELCPGKGQLPATGRRGLCPGRGRRPATGRRSRAQYLRDSRCLGRARSPTVRQRPPDRWSDGQAKDHLTGLNGRDCHLVRSTI